MSRIIIVIPCYNEAQRLPGDRFLAFAARNRDILFQFVNDGSDDATGPILEALAQRNPGQCRYLSLAGNRGKGEAVRHGILAALDLDADYVGFWDADLSTPLEEIPRFVRLYRRRPDTLVLAGARVRLMGRDIQRRAARHYLGRVFATTASALLDIRMYDTQCGAKLLRHTPGTRALFEEPFHSAWLFDLEMLLRMRRAAGLPVERLVYEVPLNAWRDVAGSKVSFRHFPRALFDLLSLRRRYRSARSSTGS